MQYYDLSLEERMTLQVGLVGCDGIVIASDRLVNIVESSSVTKAMASKFRLTHHAACCWSGDRVAQITGISIGDNDWSDLPARDKTLRELAVAAWKHQFGDLSVPYAHRTTPKKILVAFAPEAELWEMEVSDVPITTRILDHSVVGDSYTTVKHLINHYASSDLPMERLVTIAAHAVCMGCRENSGGIGGLEVVLIPKGGSPRALSLDQELELTKISEALHAQLSGLLTKPFDIRPVTPPQA